MAMNLLRNKKGVSTVEFALILPLLLLVLLGIIEFSLVLYNKAIITNASREGARTGIVFRADPNTGAYSPFDETYIRNMVVNPYLASYLVSNSAAQATTTVSPTQCPPPTAAPPRQITVTVTYPYAGFFLQQLGFFGGPGGWLNISAVTVMRCE